MGAKAIAWAEHLDQAPIQRVPVAAHRVRRAASTELPSTRQSDQLCSAKANAVIISVMAPFSSASMSTGKMAPARYRRISMMGNCVTLVTCLAAAGSALTLQRAQLPTRGLHNTWALPAFDSTLGLSSVVDTAANSMGRILLTGVDQDTAHRLQKSFRWCMAGMSKTKRSIKSRDTNRLFALHTRHDGWSPHAFKLQITESVFEV